MKIKPLLLLISLCLLVTLISCKHKGEVVKKGDENSRAVELLIKDLGNENSDIRRRAAQRAYNTKDPRVIEPLIDILLKDENEHIRVSAARALGAIKDSRAVGPLITVLLDDKSEHVKHFVAEALSKIKDPRAVEPLISVLNDETLRVRNSAIAALGEIGDTRAIEPLIKILKEGDSFENRGVAAKALGKIKDPSVVEPLIAALLNDEENDFVRIGASSALGDIGDPRAIEPLINVLLKDGNIRINVARVLGDIGDLRAVEPLVSVLKDKNPNVRSSTARALGKIKDMRAVKPLIALRKDGNSSVQISASLALNQIIGLGARIVCPEDEAKNVFSPEDFKSFPPALDKGEWAGKKLKMKPDASRGGICAISNGKVQLNNFTQRIEQTKEVIEIDTNITINTIWESGNVYHVTANVNVQALLIIEPGTVVQYGSSGALFVNNGGTLVARGTPDNLITFTSDATTPGYADYYCAIYIDQTASISTKITYSVIEFAYVGIATNNIGLDYPIQNNRVHYCVYGIGESGIELTDIVNNQIFGSYYSGINIYMASDSGAVDRDSKILITNNTCDFYQDSGITIYGSALEEDAGVVNIVNNVVSNSQKYGLNLVDGYYVVDFIQNNGYYGNKQNKNKELKETKPIVAKEFPYVKGKSPLEPCFLKQDCPFIDAGFGDITQNAQLICSTTSLQENVDADTTDIGFHYPNFEVSNTEKAIDISVHTMEETVLNLNNNISGTVGISATGYPDNTNSLFLFMDGEYIEEIWCSGYSGEAVLESHSFGNGLHKLKIASVDWDGAITFSKNISVNFNNNFYYMQTNEFIDSDRDYIVCAMYSGKHDLIKVKAVDISGNVRWSTTISNTVNGINVSIPAEAIKGIQLGDLLIEEVGKVK
ncbi:HEAT repeat domain-containing protein [bacterium]|nr:HEAT repeat domain-containing protein [bacterium]